MRTFYVFKLNKNYISVVRNNPYNIFILLNSIYTYKKSDVMVAFDLFNEICIPINKDFFDKYYYDKLKDKEEYTKFKNIHMFHDYFSGEVSKMVVNISHIKIKSNIKDNIFISNLIEGLFICDFKNELYIYLNKINDKQVFLK